LPETATAPLEERAGGGRASAESDSGPEGIAAVARSFVASSLAMTVFSYEADAQTEGIAAVACSFVAISLAMTVLFKESPLEVP
jgi:hypothetical protein